MTNAALELNQVSTSYSGSPVNRAVRLRAMSGEVVALIGRNGVGKSTLARAVVGLLTVDTGQILLYGRDITSLPAHERARLGIGYVPQGRGIFGTLSVAENLAMGFGVGVGRLSMDRAFECFPILAERRRQNAGTLSGGQQQMLAIGRILAGNPRLLVLDEPSDGIQPSIVEELGQAIPRLNKKLELTTVLIEQNLDLIKACASRCYVMEKGSIVAEIAVADLADGAVARRYLAI